jgi:drug/metabolite transporter (DMT)-like permease
VHFKARGHLAFPALLAGATGIGLAPILVRLSEVGPSATAFYRLLFALPVLWLWMRVEQGKPSAQGSTQNDIRVPYAHPAAKTAFVVAGLWFTADLAVWHWSLKFTSVANSTLLTNFAPFFVLVGARIWFAERISFALVAGLGLAFAGGAMLVGQSFKLSADHVLGDALALATAVFYAGYLLTVKYLRRTALTSTVMCYSGLVSCPALLVVTLLSEKSLLAVSGKGWLVLITMALVSHIGGQGLIAFALAHLPASFSAVGLLWQPVVAAALAWLILGEPMSWLQIGGGAVVLAGIVVARNPPEETPQLVAGVWPMGPNR